MKKIISLFLRLSIYAICGMLAFTGCKKVDDHATMVLSQPWFADHYTQQAGSWLAPVNWNYPATLIVGDTAMLLGKLFPSQPGTVITVGGVPIKIIDTAQFSPNYTTYNAQGKIDAVRFIVTKEMGIGKGRQVSITANGNIVTGPPVTIQLLGNSAARTDTTLWVDQLAHWMPADMDVYSRHQYDLVRCIHVDKSGNIYFNNQLSVQQVTAGQVSTVFKAGDVLHDDQGSFTIKQVLSSAVTFEGDSLYFSAEVQDNKTDESSHYIFRLCKMSLQTKVARTLNRTLVANTYAPDENGSPFQGNVSQLKIVASYLNTDLNNNLYYTNIYAPGSTTNDHSSWYGPSGISGGMAGADPYDGLILISRLDTDGRVHGLMNFEVFYPSIGYPVSANYYWCDPSGDYLYGFYTSNFVQYQMLPYNVTEDTKGSYIDTYQTKYAYQSYETDPKYKRVDGGGFLVDPTNVEFNQTMQLYDGATLAVVNYSLSSYNLQTKRMYVYAGTEIGSAYGSAPEAQNKETGLAKWVNFTGASLIGQDKNGAVYYCKGFNDYTKGVTFYKLYPKKQ
ncbi:hypothetical protein [Chitinophaga eiseniae]|uniref:Uncharacterized protein n=1 Tax=Chitinophaga eiseniae TaxID=634771 RepID=A0A847SME5_9BACT|nr:hypothetical protein [Chitinophaga eiseniae]NLR80395.1 hypothetical protein [Chitinophaga eiseniae]